MKDEEQLVNLLFPPWKLMARFLLVTMLLITGTGLSGTLLFISYFNGNPERLIGTLFIGSIVFCIINFLVTRGVFICSKILKYYALCLIILSITLLLEINSMNYFILLSIDLIILLSAFYLISGKTYQKFVQYQFDFFEDIKEAKRIIDKEIAASKRGKNSS